MFPSRDPFDRLDRIRKALGNSNFPNGQIMDSYVDQSVDEEENVLSVVMDIPGVRKDDIDAKVEEHRGHQWLVVDAENQNGSMNRHFRREIALRHRVDAELADTDYNNGVLTVQFPLLDPKDDHGIGIDIE